MCVCVFVRHIHSTIISDLIKETQIKGLQSLRFGRESMKLSKAAMGENGYVCFWGDRIGGWSRALDNEISIWRMTGQSEVLQVGGSLALKARSI